jgi:twinkle protein
MYADSHWHCFKCSAHGRSEAPTSRLTSGLTSSGSASSSLLRPSDYPQAWRDRTSRGVRADTLRLFGTFNATYSGKNVMVYPYYGEDGEPSAQKLRFVGDKSSFPQLKAGPSVNIAKGWLYGRHVWGDRFDRRVVVTEGEEDCHAVVQETDKKFAVVSLPNGANGAAAALKSNYLWLDRFEEIVLWFDNDEPGREAAEECAKLFKVGKVKIATAPDGFKDANALIQPAKDFTPRPGDILQSIYAARPWRPRGIVNARENVKDVLAPKERALFYNYPPCMPRLQEMTGGIHMAEVSYHVAGTGVGKSSQLREIMYHLLEQGCKIGLLSFEDTVREAKMGLMSIAASERLHLRAMPDASDSEAIAAYDEEMTRWHHTVFGSGLVELFDPETAEWQMEAILGYIRYLAKGLDCKVIIIDPLSFVAAGIDLTADERRVLDKVAAELAKLCKELGVHIMVSHHLKRTSGVPHEEGASTSLNELRSSGGLANFAMGVIGWERNNAADGEDWRITQSRILKPFRRVGRSGVADILFYQENGRTILSPRPFPPIGKPESDDAGEQQSQRGFAPVKASDY